MQNTGKPPPPPHQEPVKPMVCAGPPEIFGFPGTGPSYSVAALANWTGWALPLTHWWQPQWDARLGRVYGVPAMQALPWPSMHMHFKKLGGHTCATSSSVAIIFSPCTQCAQLTAHTICCFHPPDMARTQVRAREGSGGVVQQGYFLLEAGV